MAHLNTDLITAILSSPSFTGSEGLVLDAIREFAAEKGWLTRTDNYGNMYVQKGELNPGERFPVLVAHVDTVHRDHLSLIKAGGRLDILEKEGILKAYHPVTGEQTGIGGDDKAGVVVALEVLSRVEKGLCAFFREEEVGCFGSMQLDREIMEQGGYAIQFDAPGNEVSVYVDGVKLYDNAFLDLIASTLSAFGVDEFVKYNPYTDIARIREQLDYNTLNMGAGYHDYHTSTEYVVVSEMERAVECAVELIQVLGNRLHLFDEFDAEAEVGYDQEDEWIWDDSVGFENSSCDFEGVETRESGDEDFPMYTLKNCAYMK